VWQRTLIPVIKSELIVPPSTSGKPCYEFGSAVFALARTADREERYARLDISKLWTEAPNLNIGTEKDGYKDKEWYLRFM
jgi:hypothetical protein